MTASDFAPIAITVGAWIAWFLIFVLLAWGVRKRRRAREAATAQSAGDPESLAESSGGQPGEGSAAEPRSPLKALFLLSTVAVLSSIAAGVLYFSGAQTTVRSSFAFALATAGGVAAIWLLTLVSVELLRRRPRIELAFGAVLGSLVLTAIAYVGVPSPGVTTAIVIVTGAIALVGFGFLVVALVAQLRRQELRKVVAVMAAVSLVAGVLLVVGLNAFTNLESSAAKTIIQSDYAEIATASELGDAVHAGNAPSGVTFSTVSEDAGAAVQQLSQLSVPGQLGDYLMQVELWGKSVQIAGFAASLGHPWSGILYWPAPFTIAMDAGAASAAANAAYAQAGQALEFGNYAMATGDYGAMVSVSADLAAQSYWLEGVLSSQAEAGAIGTVVENSPAVFVVNGPQREAVSHGSPTLISHQPLPTLEDRNCPQRDVCFNPPRGPFTQDAGSFDRLQALRAAAASVGDSCHSSGGGNVRQLPAGPCYTAAQDWAGAQDTTTPQWGENPFPPSDTSGLRSCTDVSQNPQGVFSGGACVGSVTPPQLQDLHCPGNLVAVSAPPLGVNGAPVDASGWYCATPKACPVFYASSGVGYDCTTPLVPGYLNAGGPFGSMASQIGNAIAPPSKPGPPSGNTGSTGNTGNTGNSGNSGPPPTGNSGRSPSGNSGGESVSWDGTYAVSYSGGCNIGSSPVPWPDSMSVSNNVAYPGTSYSIAINSAGYGSLNGTASAGGGNANSSISLQFSMVGGGVSDVQGSWSLTATGSAGGATESIQCSGTISGRD